MKSKHFKIGSILLGLFLNSIVFATTAQAANGMPLDSIVAQVNHEVITQSQLDKETLALKRQLLASQVAIPPEKELRRQVLQQMIDQSLQMQKAKEVGITANDTMVDQAISNIAKQNNVPMSKLKQMVIAQGLSYRDYRETIRKQIIISKLQQQAIGGSVNVDKSEVTQLLQQAGPPSYSQYRVQDTLVPLPDNPTPMQVAKAKAKANTLLSKLHKGLEVREATAAQFGNNIQINDLGWRTADQLPTQFAQQIKSMRPGSVVGPIRAANGFHIIKLLAARAPKGQNKLNDAQAQQIVYSRKFSNALENWLRQLRAASYVKVLHNT